MHRTRNAPAIITKYWKTQAADKQHERFPKNSKQAKAAKEAAAEPRSSASKAKSKKRAAEESEEEQDDELELKDDSADESDDAPKSRRKSTSSAKGNGSVKKERKASPPPAKKAKKTYSAKKGGKKAKEPTPTPSVEEEAEVEVQEEDKKSEADIEELSGHGHPMSNNDAKHMNEKNWDVSLVLLPAGESGSLILTPWPLAGARLSSRFDRAGRPGDSHVACRLVGATTLLLSHSDADAKAAFASQEGGRYCL